MFVSKNTNELTSRPFFYVPVGSKSDRVVRKSKLDIHSCMYRYTRASEGSRMKENSLSLALINLYY